MIVFGTFADRACTDSTYHGLCVRGFKRIAVMVAFAAMFIAIQHVDARAIAILGVCRAQCAALATVTDFTVTTFGTGRAAALVGIQRTIACFTIDMVAVNAVRDFTLSIRANTRFPAGDTFGAYISFLSAVIDGVIHTSVFVEVHVFLASGNMT